MKESTTITKEKIAEQLKSQLGLSALMCEEITLQLFSAILDLTKENNKIMLQNFGTWKVNYKKPRPGFNIQTGNSVEIKSRSVLRFIPSKYLRKKINSDA